jgi:hypothetical protein
MTSRREFLTTAGLATSLPLFFFGAAQSHMRAAEAPASALPQFHAFKSSCIDLGNYNPAKQELTVRFAGREWNRFYRYQRVPAKVWSRLQELNQKGGVGNYLHEAVIQKPQEYPFTELTIEKFEVAVK